MKLGEKKYRNVYILESRNQFSTVKETYDSKVDLILTFDFALKTQVEKLGGEAMYIDSLCQPSEMQANNFIAAEFFKNWHYNKQGKDIFTASGVAFGFALRIEIWNEYLYYVRLRLNLAKLNSIQHSKIYVCESSNFLSNLLHDSNTGFQSISPSLIENKAETPYYFDIHKYMATALRGTGIKATARKTLTWILSYISFFWDKLFNKSKVFVYAQNYHPSQGTIERLEKDNRIRLVTSSLIPKKGLSKYFKQRMIPIGAVNDGHAILAKELLEKYENERCAELILSDGQNITLEVHRLISKKIAPVLPEALTILESAQRYLTQFPVRLEVMIANIGLLQTIVDCILRTQKVPSYLIINGILSGKYSDESKYSKHINAYSKSIKANYFQNLPNAHCLGDPRMDKYAGAKAKNINREAPTITIGTSGFNGVNLISHTAIEFDYMFDLLTGLIELRRGGNTFSTILKVRPNGYLAQYKSFVDEYFPSLDVQLVQTTPIHEVLHRTDLYISIYSQTLFEASCLGIPAIYYKKDAEYLDPPFDGTSELVTVNSVGDFVKAFHKFLNCDEIFDQFLKKNNMEKYIGPLDGENLDRNIGFIYQLLEMSAPNQRDGN